MGKIEISLVLFIFLLIASGIGIVLLLTLILSKRKKQHIQPEFSASEKQLLYAAFKTEQRERERIAKNIHDDLSLTINVARMSLVRMVDETEGKENNKFVRSYLDVLDSVIQYIRNIAAELYPPILKISGYYKAVAELADFISDHSKVHVCVEPTGMPRPVAHKELQLYRITLELLNNIIKHDCPSRIDIFFSGTEHLSIRIQHDGKGITNEQIRKFCEKSKGLGLKSIEGRASLLNASVEYRVRPDKKAEVEVICLNPIS
jgi:signal transduction histidine kinase